MKTNPIISASKASAEASEVTKSKTKKTKSRAVMLEKKKKRLELDRREKSSKLPSNLSQSPGDSGLGCIKESTKDKPKEPKYTPEKIAEFAKLGLHLGEYRMGRD
ncbi:hypothetical protein EAF00_006752 [Botryotinia globosa]|nr:hypothetical protein EAF00_006752 [Botryotinia globosa]